MNGWLKQRYVIVRRYVNCVRLLGSAGVVIVLRSLLGSKAEVQCTVNGAQIWVRLNTTDLDTLLQIFFNHEYRLPLSRKPGVVVDAGANVGYAAVYFAVSFPDAKVYALEPEPDNFAQLRKHCQRYPQIVPIQAALWSEDAELQLVDAGQGAWGFRVSAETGAGTTSTVEALSVDTILSRYDIARIDLFKIDIEGSEKELFEQSESWLNQVDALVVELHDRYRVGCARAFYTATHAFEQEVRVGENIFIAR